MDWNFSIFVGVIGDDYQKKKTRDGKEYITFSLCVNSFVQEMADDTERTHSQQYLRIFVYDKRCLAYLTKVKAHRGERAIVFGRTTSAKNEYRGINFITQNITARDIAIIKTQ